MTYTSTTHLQTDLPCPEFEDVLTTFHAKSSNDIPLCFMLRVIEMYKQESRYSVKSSFKFQKFTFLVNFETPTF